MSDRTLERKTTAYHEAAHAVIAYRLGLLRGRTSILPNPKEESLGRAIHEGEWFDGTYADSVVIVAYAGYEAEKLIDQQASPLGSASEDEEAAEILSYHLELCESELREKAREMVRRHWEEISAVAEALLEDETLESEEIELIADAVAEGEDWRSILAEFRFRFGRHSSGCPRCQCASCACPRPAEVEVKGLSLCRQCADWTEIKGQVYCDRRTKDWAVCPICGQSIEWGGQIQTDQSGYIEGACDCGRWRRIESEGVHYEGLAALEGEAQGEGSTLDGPRRPSM